MTLSVASSVGESKKKSLKRENRQKNFCSERNFINFLQDVKNGATSKSLTGPAVPFRSFRKITWRKKFCGTTNTRHLIVLIQRSSSQSLSWKQMVMERNQNMSFLSCLALQTHVRALDQRSSCTLRFSLRLLRTSNWMIVACWLWNNLRSYNRFRIIGYHVLSKKLPAYPESTVFAPSLLISHPNL